MPVQTIDSNAPLGFIKIEIDTTRSRLEVNPLTAALAAPFTVFEAQTWLPVHHKEMDLDYALTLAKARVTYADDTLNALVKKLDGALLMITNKDRGAPLYQLYFGAQRPFEVNAPLLGPQLETMRGWIPSLKTSTHDPLQTIGAEIEAAVTAADAAVLARADAENAQLAFRTTGERTALVDAFNALRKSTYGKLGEIRHQHPELPNDFADGFFRHETKRRDDKLSSEQIQAKIDALHEEEAGWKAKLEAAIARETAEASAKQQEETRLVALAEKKKQAAALAAEIKKLEG
jgi:hypothetical protein